LVEEMIGRNMSIDEKPMVHNLGFGIGMGWQF